MNEMPPGAVCLDCDANFPGREKRLKRLRNTISKTGASDIEPEWL